MYKSVGIEKLSDNQLCRLRNGHSVRVKLGSHHNIHLSVQQLKKLQSASKKGKAFTITFDPYQKEAHGCGTFGDIARKTKRGDGVIGKVLNTIGEVADVVGLGVCRKHEAPVKVKKARKIRKGKGFFSDLKNIAKSAVKDVAQKGIESGTKYITDKVATSGAPVRDIAQIGIDAGTNYITDKIGGAGVIHKKRRIVGRRVIEKKKTHGGSGSGVGGSLMPAGFSGSALFPSGFSG